MVRIVGDELIFQSLYTMSICWECGVIDHLDTIRKHLESDGVIKR